MLMSHHRIGCTRTRTMGDPICSACRNHSARNLSHARIILARNRKADKLKPTGAAHRDRLVRARLDVRS